MVVAELKIVPIGTGDTSLSRYVAAIQRYLEANASARGVTYELTSMSTILDGDRDTITALAYGAADYLFDQFPMEVHRLSIDLHVDDRRDKPGSSAQKLRSVRERLQSNGA